MVAFTGSHLTYKQVVENLHVLDYDYYFKLTSGFLEQRLPEVMVVFDDILKKGFDGDSWPNIMSSSSLMSDASLQSFKDKKYSVWNRNLDRLFFLLPSNHLANNEGRKFFKALSTKLDRKTLLNGLGGYHLSEQFFPPGYVIFDPEFNAPKSTLDIPAEYKKSPPTAKHLQCAIHRGEGL
jgi:hypothetical protein